MSKQGPETKLCNKMRKAAIADYGERQVMVKNHGSEFSRAGVSDFTGCIDGVFVAIEVKAPESYPVHGKPNAERALRKGPTTLQRAFVQHVLDAGGCAGFAATIEQFQEVLDHAAERAVRIGGTGTPCRGHNIIEDD